MVAPARRRRRRIQVPEEVVEVEEEELEDVVLDDEEDEEEEVTPPKKVVRRKKAVVVEPEEDEDEEDEEEDEPVVTTRKSSRRVKKEEAPAPVTKRTAAVTTTDPIGLLLNELEAGSVIFLKALGDGEYHMQVSTGAAIAVGPQKLTGKAYWDEVLSKEFKDHDEEWKQLSYKEKLAAAKKLKATWESHEDERVDVMRITEAVRTKMGISKYKPEYEDRSARATIRG